MLNTNTHPVLHPAPRHTLAFDEYGSPPIALPPPTTFRASKSHQRSRTAVDLPPLLTRNASPSPTRSSTFLPFLRSARDRSISPERVSAKEAAEFEVTTPPEEPSEKQKGPGKVEKLASWFDGASDPVRISVVPSPTKEASDAFGLPSNMERLFSASTDSVDTFTRRPKRPTLATNTIQASTGRFNFFRKTSQAQLKPNAISKDELAQLDVHTALFPTGDPDEFSPAAFKNLQMNAEGTLHRLQDAYKENLRALKAVTSEKNIQADELEATQTRTEHLKLQLTEMAETAAEQEKTIAALREELAMERRQIERQKIRMVTTDNFNESFTMARRPGYRKNRISDVSTSNESESGSDLSSGASVFSEPMTADYSQSPGTSVCASPVLKSAIMFKPTPSPRREHIPVQVMMECGKCHGVKLNEAWDVIGIMKMESMALKGRIEELEGAQDDALDFVNGLMH